MGQPMDWIDLAALTILAVFVLIGATRGFLASLLGVVSLIVSYAAGFFGATVLAGPLALHAGVHPLLAGLLTGTVAFLGTGVVMALVTRAVLRRHRARRQRVPLDIVGGGLIGGLQGALLAVLVYWVAGQVQAAGLIGEPDATPSALSRASQEMVQAGADAVLAGDDGGRLMARLVADPAGTSQQLQEVLDSPAIGELQRDELFWQYLSSGAVDSALNRGAFLRISHDQALREQLAGLGVVDEAARQDPRAFRSSAREALQRIAPGLQALQSDGALEELAADPAIQEAMARGDTLALMRDPRVLALIQRAVAASSPAAPAEE